MIPMPCLTASLALLLRIKLLIAGQLPATQVAVPEEAEAEGSGARMRHFRVKIKWASSINVTDIDQYMKCATRLHTCDPSHCSAFEHGKPC